MHASVFFVTKKRFRYYRLELFFSNIKPMGNIQVLEHKRPNPNYVLFREYAVVTSFTKGKPQCYIHL